MNKLNTARVLMIASILVIAAFQCYWLYKLYRDEYDGLKRTSDIVFKESLYQLQVSRFENDSMFRGIPPADIFSKDMVRVLRINKDSIRAGRGKIFVSVKETKTKLSHDSAFKKDTVRTIMLRSGNQKTDMANTLKFNYRFNDSLKIESIDSAYKTALSKSHITLSYIVLKTTTDSADACPGAFCTSKVPVGIFGQNCYIASFSEPTSYLLKEISPQMLLSLLVVLLTALSFIFIYRNLLEHKRLADIKNEFISNITHELKTPIATVTVAIEAMKNFNALQNPERTREYLDIADNELQRLSLLVDKVLKLSMYEQDSLELKFESIDLKQLASEIIASMKIQFEKNHANVLLYANDDDYYIHGDRLHLVSMLYNMLDNAIKYSPGKPEVVVTLSDKTDRVRMEIKDNGVGIETEYREKIFEKFFRVPGGNRHNVKGYGLGLSYVAHIVDKHHGNIKVESQPGAGTTFIIDLPKHEKS